MSKFRMVSLLWVFSLFAGAQGWAHRDTIIKLDGTLLKGLPPEYQPATLDVEKSALTIAGKTLKFSPFMDQAFSVERPYGLELSGSWYHEPEIMPPYLLLKVTPKGAAYSYRFLVDMKKLEVFQAEIELREGEDVTRFVPIDPKVWQGKNATGVGETRVLSQ